MYWTKPLANEGGAGRHWADLIRACGSIHVHEEVILITLELIIIIISTTGDRWFVRIDIVIS